MPKVVRVREWKKKRDPKRGAKLQKLANKMLLAGDTGAKYVKVRRAAEYHLGFWLHTKRDHNYGITPTGIWRSQTDAILPKACLQAKCPHLPAGSAACMYKFHECP